MKLCWNGKWTRSTRRSRWRLWEPRLRQFDACNAGAEPPLIYRNGEILKPRTEGVPIGLLEDREYDEVVHQAERAI